MLEQIQQLEQPVKEDIQIEKKVEGPHSAEIKNPFDFQAREEVFNKWRRADKKENSGSDYSSNSSYHKFIHRIRSRGEGMSGLNAGDKQPFQFE